MTKAKTFRGATMREALAQVRRELGGDAVILSSRDVRRRGLFGLRGREMVEVTASSGASGHHPATPPARGGVRHRTDRGRPLLDQKPLEPAATAAPPPRDEPTSATPAGLSDQLETLHRLVSQLSKNGRLDHLVPDLPGPLAPLYAELLEAQIPELLARRLVREAADRLDPSEFDHPEMGRRVVLEVLEANLPVAPPIAAIPGCQRVVALVGPTGVGKTTTVAKLAANLKLVQAARVGLITVDTYRIAAVEQLKTYAEIIDLPLVVVNCPDDMSDALQSLSDVDLVLIDTAGRSPRDEVKIRELAEFLQAASPQEVHLVLSATATQKSLRAALERFAQARTDRLILTKLDEAEDLGGLLAVIAQAGRPVSYLTTGQAVPDDIEPATRGRLARLILGSEAVG